MPNIPNSWDDVFDSGPDKEAYMAVKWFVDAMYDKIMIGLVWYTQNGLINFKTISRTSNLIGGFLVKDSDNLKGWKRLSRGMATVSGGTFGVIPFVALPADVVILIDGMFRTGFGVGAILAKQYGFDHTALEREDFLRIFAQWCGVEEFVEDDEAVEEVMNAFSAKRTITKVGSKAAIKFTVKAVMKMGVKMSGNVAAVVVPGLNIAANAGINLWYIDEFFEASKIYYTRKFLRMQEEDKKKEQL